MSKHILVSGATSGIGEACAHLFALEGHKLILTGRRRERLDELRSLLEEKYNAEVKTLCFDVRNNTEVEEAIDSLEGEWRKIDALINNAGLAAGKDPIDKGLLDDWDRMIDTNVKGLLYLTRKVKL